MDIDTIDRVQRKLRQSEGILGLVMQRDLEPDVRAALDAAADLLGQAREELQPQQARALARVR